MTWLRALLLAAAVLVLTGCLPQPGQWMESTMYCLRGRTASGAPVAHGVVAVNSRDWQRLRGTWWVTVTGDQAGRVFEVLDHGPAAHFDMWTPDCAEARQYGRQQIVVEQWR